MTREVACAVCDEEDDVPYEEVLVLHLEDVVL